MVPVSSASEVGGAAVSSSGVVIQDFLVCFVNGKKHTLHAADIQPEATLLHFLRQSQLTHTHTATMKAAEERGDARMI